MAERKPLSKKTRFEVFKRDSFTCQYCGRSAPDVILEVDHIIPVAEGGKNDMVNLVTSCRDCNSGKGKRKLSDKSAIQKQKKQLDDINAAREQTEMLIEWKRTLLELENTQIEAIEDLMKVVDDETFFTDQGRKNMKSLIRKFGFSEVYDAAEIAFNYYKDVEIAFNKIGGICYNRRKYRKAEQNAE